MFLFKLSSTYGVVIATVLLSFFLYACTDILGGNTEDNPALPEGEKDLEALHTTNWILADPLIQKAGDDRFEEAASWYVMEMSYDAAYDSLRSDLSHFYFLDEEKSAVGNSGFANFKVNSVKSLVLKDTGQTFRGNIGGIDEYYAIIAKYLEDWVISGNLLYFKLSEEIPAGNGDKVQVFEPITSDHALCETHSSFREEFCEENNTE